MSKTKQHPLINMTLTAILAAVSVVLSRFLSVNVWNMSIGFAFVPVLICGLLCGPFWCGVCGALADLVGALLFPFGAYFPGFTAVAFLNGVIYGTIGIASEKVKKGWLFLIVSFGLITLSELVCSLALNSLWITILYNSPYFATVLSRVPVSAVTVVLGTLLCLFLRQTIISPLKKLKNN
ncbi:MAG: folate family ECF transporter S component [Clostridia bacterium]|nr:folate family ECF transporter S component [Clostridia bacterium]